MYTMMHTKNDVDKALKKANIESIDDLKQVAERFAANAKKIRDIGSAVSMEIEIFNMFFSGLGHVSTTSFNDFNLKIIKQYMKTAEMIEKRAAWYKKFVKKLIKTLK